ncbi:MAG: hypothetical protein FJ086_19990, partial [Deltaproteobacteria bacterium]|nr:hypothetical protein [Deltaproteobacteria bacterium]
MNRQASPVLPVLFSLLLSACLVPSLSELESERPRSCDADHPCLSGYGCVAGRCVAGEGRVCTPGDKVACGSSVGTCEEGTRTCGQDGQFGQCEGATNPTSEICDSQDNDCDGNVDSDVAQWVEQDGQPDMPVAVPFGTGDRRALVVAWEQGDSVRARRVRADGTLDEVLAPASTVTLSGYRASGPAILRCDCDSCGCHALAWFDARACDGGTCNRLLIGKLEDEGWTNVNNSGSRDAGKVTTVDTRLGKGLSMELV